MSESRLTFSYVISYSLQESGLSTKSNNRVSSSFPCQWVLISPEIFKTSQLWIRRCFDEPYQNKIFIGRVGLRLFGRYVSETINNKVNRLWTKEIDTLSRFVPRVYHNNTPSLHYYIQ